MRKWVVALVITLLLCACSTSGISVNDSSESDVVSKNDVCPPIDISASLGALKQKIDTRFALVMVKGRIALYPAICWGRGYFSVFLPYVKNNNASVPSERLEKFSIVYGAKSEKFPVVVAEKGPILLVRTSIGQDVEPLEVDDSPFVGESVAFVQFIVLIEKNGETGANWDLQSHFFHTNISLIQKGLFFTQAVLWGDNAGTGFFDEYGRLIGFGVGNLGPSGDDGPSMAGIVLPVKDFKHFAAIVKGDI